MLHQPGRAARKEGKAGDYRAVRVDASGRVVEVA